MKKRQICFTCDESLYNKLMKESKDTGLPLSNVIELRLKGFKVVKAK